MDCNMQHAELTLREGDVYRYIPYRMVEKDTDVVHVPNKTRLCTLHLLLQLQKIRYIVFICTNLTAAAFLPRFHHATNQRTKTHILVSR